MNYVKCYQQNVFTNHIYLIIMYKEDLALNNQQWLICHKTQPTKPKIAYHFQHEHWTPVDEEKKTRRKETLFDSIHYTIKTPKQT